MARIFTNCRSCLGIRRKGSTFLNAVYLLCGPILFLLCLVRDIPLSGILAIIIFAISFMSFAIDNKQLIVKHLFIFFSTLFYSMGNILCEFGHIYLVEIGVYSDYCGSFNLLAFLYWIVFFTLKPIDSWICRYIWRKQSYNYQFNNRSINGNLEKLSPLLIFFISLLLFLRVAGTPSFALDVNRFAYAKYYIPHYIDKLKSVPILLAPLVYNAVLVRRGYRSVIKTLVIYVPFVLFAFWIGNKFGLFLQLLLALLIPAVNHFDFSKFKVSNMLSVILCISFVFGGILFAFWHLRGYSLQEMINKIMIRIAQQGEIWWAEVIKGDYRYGHFSELDNEISAILTSITTKGKIKEYGIYKLMVLYGNSSYLQHYFDIDMRMSAQGFELAFYYFGYFSFVLFPIFSNFIYCLITNLYINAVNNRSLAAIPCLRGVILIQSSICQGDWYRFTSVLDIMLIVFWLFDILIRKGAFKLNIKEYDVKYN